MGSWRRLYLTQYGIFTTAARLAPSRHCQLTKSGRVHCAGALQRNRRRGTYKVRGRKSSWLATLKRNDLQQAYLGNAHCPCWSVLASGSPTLKTVERKRSSLERFAATFQRQVRFFSASSKAKATRASRGTRNPTSRKMIHCCVGYDYEASPPPWDWHAWAGDFPPLASLEFEICPRLRRDTATLLCQNSCLASAAAVASECDFGPLRQPQPWLAGFVCWVPYESGEGRW